MLYILIVCVVICFYLLSIRNQNYWEKKGIRYLKPYPLFGTQGKEFLRMIPPTEGMVKSYSSYANESIIGLFIFSTPQLMIKDPELIKQITIKSFEHFIDHTGIVFGDNVDDVLSRNLFSLNGKEWKDMRLVFSHAFTSTKMKSLFNLMMGCGEQMENYFMDITREQNVKCIEMKDPLIRFSQNVMAIAVFGMDINTFDIKNEEFFRMGKKTTEISFTRTIMLNLLPNVMKLLGEASLPNHVLNYFRHLTCVEFRKNNENLIHPNILDVLMEAQKKSLEQVDNKIMEDMNHTVTNVQTESPESQSKREIPDDEVVGNAIVFFDGFDTVSTTLVFAAYELALNVDVQRKLQKEIDVTLKECNGNISYDVLLKMKYLDMVFSETLRKWPPCFEHDRICNKTITFKSLGKDVTIEKGMSVLIPIYALHHDPKYFPNPDKFDPERFNDENKSKINEYTYLPFVVGPRSCVATRLAVLTSKIGLVYMLAKFDIEVTEETEIPLKLLKNPFKLGAVNGIWLGLRRRMIE